MFWTKKKILEIYKFLDSNKFEYIKDVHKIKLVYVLCVSLQVNRLMIIVMVEFYFNVLSISFQFNSFMILVILEGIINRTLNVYLCRYINDLHIH